MEASQEDSQQPMAAAQGEDVVSQMQEAADQPQVQRPSPEAEALKDDEDDIHM